MNANVEKIIRTACAMDLTIDLGQIESAIALLRGTPSSDADTPMTAMEAAKLLGVSTKTVVRYAERGIIRTIGAKAMGTRARYSRKSIVEYLNGGTATQNTPRTAA